MYENDTTYYVLSSIIIGKSYLQLEEYEKSEEYLLSALNVLEKKYGKYSEMYYKVFPFLISVYNLSYNFEKLMDSFLSAIDIVEKLYGKDNPDYSYCLNKLGNLYIQTSQYDLAEKYLSEALELRDKNLGKEHPDYIETLDDLGWLYFHVGDYEKARNIFMQIKEQYEAMSGQNSLFYADILVQLGDIDLNTGNLDLAEQYLFASKKMFENLNQTNMIEYINNLRYIGELNMAKNNYTEAENYLQNAKKLYIQMGGDVKNTNYVALIADLAQTYNYSESYEKAEVYFTEAIKILEETVGKKSTYAKTVNNLGTMYYSLGNYFDAEKCFSEIKEIQETIIGANHPDYALTLGNLGVLYLNTENYQLAEKYSLQSKEIYEHNKLKSSQYALVLNNLGVLYTKLGNFGLAFDYLFKSADVMKDLSGQNSPDYALTLLNMSEILNQCGNDTLAVKYAIAANEIFENNFGKEHSYYILSRNNIGNIRLKQDSLARAEWQLLEANELYIKVFGKDYFQRIVPLNNLALLYAKQKKYELALQYVLEAKELIRQNLGKDHSYNLKTYENLSFIYWLMGNYELSKNFVEEWDKYIKQRIYQNFAFMSEKQREDFWDNNNGYALAQFENTLLSTYTTPRTQSLAYDNALFSKGLLLRSTNEIRDAILNSGNQKLINQFENLRSLRQQIIVLQAKTDKYKENYIQLLENRADSLDKVLTISSSAYSEQKSDLNIEWKDIQNNLSDNEVAIEFVDYQKFSMDKNWTDTTMYAALIVGKDFDNPIFVPLFEKSKLDLLLADENENTEKRIAKLYNGGSPRFYNGQKLYHLIWQPLEKYLSGVESVYYSPSGVLNQIAFAALPVDTFLLTDKYNLHLVSSTREIWRLKTHNVAFLPVQQAVEYGGILYDVENSQNLISSAMQYKKETTPYLASRSFSNDSTRSGWIYLQGTEKEVIEIENILKK
jgi:tetratricopeptide (TPR) repeat protein